MKNLFLAAIAFACFSSVVGQVYTKPNNSYGIIYNRIKPDSVMHVPAKSDTTLNTNDSTPQIFIKGDDLWYYVNRRFYRAAASTGFVPLADSGAKYITPTGFNTLGDARYPQLTGHYNNPAWIDSLNWGKISNVPFTANASRFYWHGDGTDSIILSVGSNNTGIYINYLHDPTMLLKAQTLQLNTTQTDIYAPFGTYYRNGLVEFDYAANPFSIRSINTGGLMNFKGVQNNSATELVFHQSDTAGHDTLANLAEVVIHIPTMDSLTRYKGGAMTVIVDDTIAGGIFVKYATDINTIIDSGVIVPGYYPGTAWWRQTTQSFGVFPQWWAWLYTSGNPYYDPLTMDSSTAVDMQAAIQHAIDYYPHRAGLTNINKVFYTTKPIVVGEETVLRGYNTLFPYQISGDTQRFHTPCAIWVHNSNGIITQQDSTSDRAQHPKFENFGLFGSYTFDNPRQDTGILFNSNRNKIGPGNLSKIGLPEMKGMYLHGFYIAAMGDSVDSWNLYGGQIDGCEYGALGGEVETVVDGVDFYNINTAAYVSNGKAGTGYDEVKNCQFEVNRPNAVAIQVVNTKSGTIKDNEFQQGNTAIHVLGSQKNGVVQISGNHFWQYQDNIVIDSAASYVEISGNHFHGTSTDTSLTGTQRFIYARKAQFLTIFGNWFYKSGTSGSIPYALDTCTQVLVGLNNKFINYSGTDSFAINQGTGGTLAVNYTDNEIVNQKLISNTNSAFTMQIWNGIKNKLPLANGNLAIFAGVKGYNGTQMSGGYRAALAAYPNENWGSTSNGLSWLVGVTPRGTSTMKYLYNFSDAGLTIGDSTLATANLHIKELAPTERWEELSGSSSGYRKYIKSQSSSLLARYYNDNTGNLWMTVSTSNAISMGGNSAPVPSAGLDLSQFTTKGFLPPKMTTAQRTAISSPAEGLLVYDIDLHKLYDWDGTTWQAAW